MIESGSSKNIEEYAEGAGISYEKAYTGLITLMNTTKDEELKKQLAEHFQYSEKLLRDYAMDSEGYIYIVILHENEDSSYTYGYFADSDLAYFSGVKTGCPFEIGKHRVAGYEDVEGDGSVSEGDYGAEPVMALTFDETGELLRFHSNEKGYHGNLPCSGLHHFA